LEWELDGGCEEKGFLNKFWRILEMFFGSLGENHE